MEISNHLYINNRPVYPVSKVVGKTCERGCYSSVPNCSPVYFSPSFTAMKKNEFTGVDSLVVEKFKAPILSFNSQTDFDNWADGKCDEILNKDYKGRTEESTVQIEAMLKEWKDYLYIENDAYSYAERLLILDGVTKDLKSNTDSIPPVLNKRVLADTMDSLKNELEQNPTKKDYNFFKTYQNNLRNFYTSDIENSTGTDMTGWVIIPSKYNDPKHFDENVNKLKTLSHKNWCTKSYNAEPYLRDGDFHIYLENGKPKLGIRFYNGSIREIQGEKNNTRIPLNYYDICDSHIEEGGYSLSWEAEEEINIAEKLKEKYAHLREVVENGTQKQIFGELGIKVKKNKNGGLVLPQFKLPQKMIEDKITLSDFDSNQNKLNGLFKNVVKVEGDFDFSDTDIESTGDIRRIERNGNFVYTNKLKTLGKVLKIRGYAIFCFSSIEDLGSLEEIGGNADFKHTKNLKTLGKLKRIGGNADFYVSKIETIDELEKIIGWADFSKTKDLKTLGKLKKIGGWANFDGSGIENLGELEEIGGNARFTDAENLKSLGKLRKVGGDIYIDATLEDIGCLEEVGGDICYDNQILPDIGTLKRKIELTKRKNKVEKEPTIGNKIAYLATNLKDKFIENCL